ncbi:hypothetical protein HZS61_008833 [Fusarium oxysporum f. sp. conglutinans]|uniref:Uncharacterized protein n=1 Tax=Fusarium oxysporum f. sp. conglutinans TaxID=100902 RepID=A0A8H6H3B3_FUSOX|nr:hypothetical protein HZS61_008833 [Fusarium oxysporum f. sp. conglutinans]
MSSASPAPLLSEPSDELLGPASPGSPVPAKRTLDRSPSDRAGKRAKGRTKALGTRRVALMKREGRKPAMPHTTKFGYHTGLENSGLQVKTQTSFIPYAVSHGR